MPRNAIIYSACERLPNSSLLLRVEVGDERVRLLESLTAGWCGLIFANVMRCFGCENAWECFVVFIRRRAFLPLVVCGRSVDGGDNYRPALVAGMFYFGKLFVLAVRAPFSGSKVVDRSGRYRHGSARFNWKCNLVGLRGLASGTRAPDLGCRPRSDSHRNSFCASAFQTGDRIAGSHRNDGCEVQLVAAANSAEYLDTMVSGRDCFTL